MPQYISKLILNGVTQMDVTQDTVAANNLLSGETATKNDGSPVVGAYVPGSPTLQTITKTYTPTESAQTETITAGSGYDGIEEVDVTVNAISSTYVGSGVARNDSTDLTASGATVTAPAGYYANSASKTVASAVNTESGVDFEFETVSGQRMCKMTPWFAYTAGYINTGDYDGVDSPMLNAVPANTTITPTTSAQSIGDASYMMEGAVTVAAMPSGSATPAASITGTAATVSTGTNTLTLSKTVSNTPQVSAGYVSSGTAGNSNVSLTANVTTKAAATITPGTTNQTIASGTYLTGTQTISGDANLVAGNIKSGTSIFGVTGTYSGGGTLTVATKTATMSAVGQTLSFTGLLGTPKYWFVKTTSQISSSGSTTIYYITDGFWDGTSVKGNSFRIGSTRRIYSWTTGVTQSYSGGTLTITGGAATGSSPGQFYNGTYELTYIY